MTKEWNALFAELEFICQQAAGALLLLTPAAHYRRTILAFRQAHGALLRVIGHSVRNGAGGVSPRVPRHQEKESKIN